MQRSVLLEDGGELVNAFIISRGKSGKKFVNRQQSLSGGSSTAPWKMEAIMTNTLNVIIVTAHPICHHQAIGRYATYVLVRCGCIDKTILIALFLLHG
ncbi:MAG: hypothetical protein FWG88_11870 [Oscillospiraceae bacterium]|nr:hypothetical protein [Oscillospiraceae bacterium]